MVQERLSGALNPLNHNASTATTALVLFGSGGYGAPRTARLSFCVWHLLSKGGRALGGLWGARPAEAKPRKPGQRGAQISAPQRRSGWSGRGGRGRAGAAAPGEGAEGTGVGLRVGRFWPRGKAVLRGRAAAGGPEPQRGAGGTDGWRRGRSSGPESPGRRSGLRRAPARRGSGGRNAGEGAGLAGKTGLESGR